MRLRPASTREEILQRVREIVAAQMAMDVFEVKAGDSLDADLGIAGDDVDEILRTVHQEFGTDFTELSGYWQYFFYPEVSALGFGQAVVIVTVLALFFSIVGGLYKKPLAWLGAFVAAVSIVIWTKFVRRRREAEYESHKLRFSINEIVDAAVEGSWKAPEDIWSRIERLGQKRRLD